MIVSCNEIQLTARKAAQGCGLAYGLAEEAGVAARFLGRSGIEVIPPLVQVLEQTGSLEPSANPLIVGPTLGDRLLLGEEPSITLGPVTAPALLPGYLTAIMRPLRIGWDGAVTIMVCGRICRVEAGRGAAPAAAVVVEFISDPPILSPELEAAWDRAPDRGVAVEPEPWRRLQALAAKILTPESESSRLHGAGAGLIDDD